MSELKWNWVYYPYLDPPEKQEESALKAGYNKVYLKSEADKVIAELKAKLESVQATAYAESVDAGMRERKLKRALWISRAKAYRYISELIACFNPDYVRNRKMFTPNNLKQKQMNSLKWARLMLKIERKCRAKAEEYK